MLCLSPTRKLKKSMINSKSSKPQPVSLSDVVLGNERGRLAILKAMEMAAKDQQKIVDKANGQ